MADVVHLLRSSHAGATTELKSELERVAGRDGREVIDLTGVDADASRRALRHTIDAGEARRVVVAGGDGLVHLAINELAGTDLELGLLPHGTGNDFARALGVAAADPDVALGPTRPIDALRVRGSGGDRWVASIATAGFPASINARANALDLRLGAAIYAVAALLELPRFRRSRVDVVIDGHDQLTLESAMLAVGNTAYFGGGMLACPDATPDDGLLHLTSIEGVGRIRLLQHLAGRKGGTADRPEVLRRTGKVLEIRTGSLDLWGDGEFVTTTPATIEIVPSALRVTASATNPSVQAS